MKKYYIFSINKEFYEVYKNNPQVLFKTLDNLYNLDLENAYYGLNIYNQLCKKKKKKIIRNYLYDGNTNESKFIINNSTLLEINTSCLVLVTTSNIPNIIKNLKYYESPLFLCDFDNTKFFFIT